MNIYMYVKWRVHAFRLILCASTGVAACGSGTIKLDFYNPLNWPELLLV